MGLVLQNGVLVGAANIAVVIGGDPLTGIRKIDYGKKQKKENVYGFGKEPIGRGRGQAEYSEATMEILEEEWKRIVAAAPQRDATKIGLFDIPIVYDNSQFPPVTLNNCEFTGSARTINSGDTSIFVAVGFLYAGLNE